MGNSFKIDDKVVIIKNTGGAHYNRYVGTVGVVKDFNHNNEFIEVLCKERQILYWLREELLVSNAMTKALYE